MRALWRTFGSAFIALAMAAALAMVAAPAVLIVAAGATLLLPQAKIVAAKEAFPPLPESLTFIDRFRTLDDSRWHFSDGWNNGTWMENDWRRDALSITPNGLAITMRPNPPGPDRRPFMSGELQSRELYLYGYYEASMRIPNGPGLISALFTYVKPHDNSTWEEIDIEFMGARPRLMELTYHVHGFSKQETINLGFDPSQSFNTYGFEWTPTALRWYVNNQLVHEVTDARVQRLRRPQRYYLSLWGTIELWRWAEALNPADAPWVMEVSCVARAERYEGRSICASPRRDP
ncbi:MAG: family 16 glycosylhydrolase [Hyphomonadaceae bacterium]|nr:family 16 glycosylhydrolase [Hyphomonadaceae bacterium]